MPRNVRNFWIAADIDGRASQLSGGPARKDGGLSIRFYQRDQGDITTPLRLDAGAMRDGQLWTELELIDQDATATLPDGTTVRLPARTRVRVTTCRDRAPAPIAGGAPDPEAPIPYELTAKGWTA